MTCHQEFITNPLDARLPSTEACHTAPPHACKQLVRDFLQLASPPFFGGSKACSIPLRPTHTTFNAFARSLTYSHHLYDMHTFFQGLSMRGYPSAVVHVPRSLTTVHATCLAQAPSPGPVHARLPLAIANPESSPVTVHATCLANAPSSRACSCVAAPPQCSCAAPGPNGWGRCGGIP
jgi:hypothetical protein